MRPSCSQPDFLCCASSVTMSSSSGCTSPAACFHSRGTKHIFLGSYWSASTDLRFPKSFPCKGARRASVLRASAEKGKQRGPKDRKPGEKQGKRKDNVWSADNEAARSGAGYSGSRKDNVWSGDSNARGSSGANAVKGGKTGGKITPSGTGVLPTGSRAGSLGGENGVGLSADGFSATDSAKRDSENDVGSRLQKFEDVVEGSGRYAENSSQGSSYARVRISASLPTKVEAVLQPEELAASPLWKTFSSSVSGVWRGVGAAFSPITADMEAMSLGEDNEYLYDAHVLCIVQPTEVKEQDGISPRLARKVFSKFDNPHGEQGLGEVVVQHADVDELDLMESGVLRGEAGEAVLLDEFTPVGLIGTEEIQSVEQDMLPIPWEDQDQFLILSDLEGVDSVPDTEWESEINVAGEIVVDWEKGEGALSNLGLPKELVGDQITADWRTIIENDEKVEKRWDAVWDVTEIEVFEGHVEAFSPEEVFSGSSSLENSEAAWTENIQEHFSPAPASTEGIEDHSSETVHGDWDDVMEEDLMGQEPGLIFFEDGSYSRGPLRLLAQATSRGDDQYALPPTFKCLVSGGHRRLRVVHTISIEDGGEEVQVLRVVAYEEEWVGPASMPSISGSGGHKLVPFSRRPRLLPDQLTGSWKSFAKIASVGCPPRGEPSVVFSTKEASVMREPPPLVSLPEGEEKAAHIGDITDVSILWLPGGISATVDIQEEGVLTIGASWLLADGTRIAVERDYNTEGHLAEVRTLSEVKGGWIGGRM